MEMLEAYVNEDDHDRKVKYDGWSEYIWDFFSDYDLLDANMEEEICWLDPGEVPDEPLENGHVVMQGQALELLEYHFKPHVLAPYAHRRRVE